MNTISLIVFLLSLLALPITFILGLVKIFRHKKKVKEAFRSTLISFAALVLSTIVFGFTMPPDSGNGSIDESKPAIETSVEETKEETESSTEAVTETSTEAPTETSTEATTEVPTEKPTETKPVQVKVPVVAPFTVESVPEYAKTSKPYAVVNDNVPYFTEEDYTTKSYEHYSELDALGRCGVAISCIGEDIMPTEKRGSIGSVKPSGWHTVKYDCVDGKYLYNRCHLIGYQLTAENANRSNLITGTRYLNVDGMLPFENMVADYIKETGNHVLYRVTPVFEGNNLVASGVLMEAKSMEDDGDGILFNVYCYNVQPGVEIDYATGDSKGDGTVASETKKETTAQVQKETKAPSSGGNSASTNADYVLNTNTKKFHVPSCSSADDIKASNREEFSGNRDELINRGYDACKRCNP